MLEVQERERAQARTAARPGAKVQVEEALQLAVEAGQPPAGPVIASQRLSRLRVPNSGAGLL